MCDKHTHAKVETWITPESSRHLSAKMIQLWPGDSMPRHCTRDNQEEVLLVIYGTAAVMIDNARREVGSGEAIFIPTSTWHSVESADPTEGVQYAYVTNKKQPCAS